MFQWKIFFTVLFTMVLLSVLRLAAWAPVAQAHGESVLTVTPDTIDPGGKITVKGIDMGVGEAFKITLEGLKYQAGLGDATADDKEEFTLEFTVPTDVPEGVYQLKAAGEDGDVVTTELTITPTKAAAEAEPTPAVEQMPSAAEHEIARSRTPVEVIGLGAFIVVSAVTGLFLLRGK